METNGNIIVCDDEQDIRDMLCEYLQHHGFAVSPAENGEALRALLETTAADIVILDINMPGEDGLSLTRFLRGRGGTGIIMLTAAGDVVDRIVGLEMGADDYLAKPVDLRELLARIKAVLRRATAPAPDTNAPRPAGNRIQFGRCMLDIEACKLFDEDGMEIALTAMEFDLLKVFAEHQGRVLNRDQLLELAHDRNWDPFDRSIDIRISRLRRKLESDPKKPAVIKTVRGMGYLFDPKA
ncbi:MAG TPA: response regulator [Afifellaceae bacterium]|nr:response regulator [Afifellaceae bacterium]